MAIPISIEKLINGSTIESNRIEFKASFNPNPVIHTICAFANDIDNIGGGYIVLGVEEKDGMPVFPVKGIEKNKIDGIMKELVGYCHCIEPRFFPVVESVEYKGKYLIVIWVFGGYGRPYKASKDVFTDKSSKYYYIRKFSSSIIASHNEEKELFYISSDIPFDDRPNLEANLSDLDLGLMREHLKEINSDLYRHSSKKDVLDLAKDLQLVEGPPENLKPLNVGILMFSENIHKYFRYAKIEVVYLPDLTGVGMIEQTFSGPIQRQLRNALSYIKSMLKEVTIKVKDKAEAIKFWNYPYAAIEEILSNAVYHRSYQIREPIQVRITNESIEITSHPGFDRSITDEAIEKYDIRAKIYRNRRIGDFLKELKLIESRNTGFPNAFKALKENGSEMPIFEMDSERNYLSVTLKIHSYFVKDTEADKAKAYETRIINALKKKPMSLTELAYEMGYKGISKKLRDTVKVMLVNKSIKQILDKATAKPKYDTICLNKRQ